MQLGYLCKYSEEEVNRAAELEFDCLELRDNSIYGPLDDPAKAAEAAAEVREVLDTQGVAVSAVAHYSNPLAVTPERALLEYRTAFAIAEALGTDVIASLAGSVPEESTEDNLKRFAATFGPVAAAAADAGMRIAFENWPGFGGEMPFRPVNLARSPALWRRMFEAVDSSALGLEFDPSHLVRIGVDHIDALKDFAPRVYHVHAKDTEMLYDSIADSGYYGGKPFRYRIPGYGEIDWAEFISALIEIGYDGAVVIEHEDPVFHGERFEEGLVRGWGVLEPLIHP